jgi:hypothetical protein
MFKRTLAACVFAWSLNAVAIAGTIDLGMNEDSAELSFRQVISEDTMGSSELVIKGVYDSKNENASIIAVGLDVFGELLEGLDLGIGARIYGADVEDYEAAFLALGGMIKFVPPALYGVGFYGNAYYSPKVFSWADADNMLDIDAGVSYQLVPRAAVFVGYNKTKIDFEIGGWVTVDEGVRGGISISF